MIEINNVSKFYGAFQVLKDCTASIARGEVVVVEDRLGVTMTEIIKDGDAAV